MAEVKINITAGDKASSVINKVREAAEGALRHQITIQGGGNIREVEQMLTMRMREDRNELSTMARLQ